MGRLLPSDSIGTPTRWHLVFQPVSELWWVNWIVPGRFKHVRAFGLIPDTDVWIFFDVGFRKAELFVATGRAASYTIGTWIEGADVLVMAPAAQARAPMWMPLLCTTAIARLLGLQCVAVTPSTFHRRCLQNGATAIYGQAIRANADARPDAGPAHEDCPAAAGAGAPD